MPQFMIRDPEVIKKIAVKDFDYFEDHRSFTDSETDKLWGNSLFLMIGEKWRAMRATLSPAFTGSKMRQMFELVSDCANDVVNTFSAKAKAGELIDIEMKDFFSRYTNDVIASCAFGIKVNSFTDPANEFYVSGRKIMNFGSFSMIIRMFLLNKLPSIARLFKLQFSEMPPAKLFKSMILDTMDMRKIQNIYRPDMINIMMQVREGSLKHQVEDEPKNEQDGFATVEESDVGRATVTRKWNDDEVVAQCLLFFAAGFDTSSTVLTLAAYELVANPDIQQKLYEEILQTNEGIGGKPITYDVLQKMKYMDQVICETLRKWPPAPQIDRLCVKDYVYKDENYKFNVEKGISILISIFGLHRDEKYFPNPERFDPERFNDENKDSIIPGTYIPFGVGPRNCIGIEKITLNLNVQSNCDISFVFRRFPFCVDGVEGHPVLFAVKLLVRGQCQNSNSHQICEIGIQFEY